MKKVNFNNLHEIDKAHGICGKLWEKAKTIMASETVGNRMTTMRASAGGNAATVKKAKI